MKFRIPADPPGSSAGQDAGKKKDPRFLGSPALALLGGRVHLAPNRGVHWNAEFLLRTGLEVRASLAGLAENDLPAFPEVPEERRPVAVLRDGEDAVNRATAGLEEADDDIFHMTCWFPLLVPFPLPSVSV